MEVCSRTHFYAAIKKYGWENIKHEIIEDNIETQEEADMDFAELGFAIKPNEIVQCHDEIEKEKYWVRHIVQSKTIWQK